MNFLKKIFSPFCLIISLALFFFTFYKAQIRFDGLRNDYYINYYVISFLMLLFSIISFFLNQKIKEYLMITFLTIIIFFYILEKYLIHFNSEGRQLAQKKQVYEKEINNKYDTRSRIELYEDLRKLDYDVTLTVSPQNHFNSSNSYFPLSGISNMQTIHCNENGYYSTYESDRYGFNNPDEEWESSEIEYLLVGDSFTHGACVNRPNDISSY